MRDSNYAVARIAYERRCHLSVRPIRPSHSGIVSKYMIVGLCGFRHQVIRRL